MSERVLVTRLKVEGLEETKARLQEAKAASLGVTSAKITDARATRDLARDARILNQQEAYQTQIFLAQHPVINSLSKAMSAFGSVARSALTITTAFNVAALAFNSTNSTLLDLQGQLAQAQRDQSLALSKFGYDSEEYADASEKVDVLQAKIKEFNDQMTQEKITNVVNFGASFALMTSSIITSAPKVAAAMPGIIAAFVGLDIALAPFLLLAGAVALVIGAIALALYLILTPGDQVTEFFKSLGIDIKPAADAVDFFFNTLIGWFVNMPQNAVIVADKIVAAFQSLADNLAPVWEIIKTGFINAWNGIIGIVNSAVSGILKGVEAMANGFVDAINRLIKAWNSIPGQPFKISTIGHVSLPYTAIPTIAAANGFEGVVNSPTMFLTGEAGPEHVSVTPSGRGGSGAQEIHIHVHGGIITEQRVGQIADDAMKRLLKRSGFKA